MLPLRSVLLGHRDREKLQALLENMDTVESDRLFDELDAATIVADDALPDDVVTMNSIVTFIDLDTSAEMTRQLVYPHEVAAVPGSVSVLAPVGAALIGLREGQTIEWPLPNGRLGRLKVISVERP